MKVLLLSDSHGNTSVVKQLAEKYPNMDLYLHAGDSEDLECALFPFETVKGNCDHYEPMYEKRIFDSPYGKILMSHYPDVSLDKDIKIFIHGHTHKREIRTENDTIIICPGSISFSRDADGESYAVLEINKEAVDVKIYSLNNKMIIYKGKIS